MELERAGYGTGTGPAAHAAGGQQPGQPSFGPTHRLPSTLALPDTAGELPGVARGGRDGPLTGALTSGSSGGRYWVRTSDLFGVNEARYHCANHAYRLNTIPSGKIARQIWVVALI